VITVNDITPSSLSYTTPNTYTKGTAITSLSPTVSGGAVVSYAISPSLPAGLTINTSTGVISGTPIVKSAKTSYTVTATNTGGSITASLSITITSPEEIIHVQKLASQAKVQPNSTYNITFTFIVSNLISSKLDSVLLSDDLRNAISLPATFSIISVQTTGGLKVNSSYNGSTNNALLLPTSSLLASAVDTIKLTINIVPNSFNGQLINTASISASSIYGSVAVQSTSVSKENVTTKTPTPFELPALKIDIPEGFSPNHDGINDKFVITKPFGTTIELQVFNRWGSVVYYNKNYNNEWDGTGAENFIGSQLVDGGYYYSVKATDTKGETQLFKGFVIIQR